MSDNLSGNFNALKISTQIENRALEMLRDSNAQALAPIMAERIGETPRGDVMLTTNVYGVLMDDTVVYRYDVKIKGFFAKRDGTEKEDDLAKKTIGDAISVERRALCRDLFITFKKLEQAFLTAGEKCVYYDLQSILFSLAKFNIPQSGSAKFTIKSDKLPPSCSNYERCELEITPVKDSFELKLGQFGFISLDLNLSEHSLSQFIDIATSQALFFNSDEHITFTAKSSYLLDPTRFNLRNDLPYFSDTDSYLSYGAQKSVRFIEGPQPNGCAASLIVETKKTAFHSVSLLVDKAKCLVKNLDNLKQGDINKLHKFFKKLYVETNHSKRRQRFFIKSIVQHTARNKLLSVDGKEISVEQYFQERYKIKLQFPTAPLVETGGRDGSRFYPMELCTVCDNQRVKTDQQTPNMTQQTIRQCAVPPFYLKDQNRKTAESLHLWDSEYLANAHLQITKRAVDLGARQLPLPEMEAGRGEMSSVNTRGYNWQVRQFFSPASCKVWAAYAFLDEHDKLSPNDFQEFLKRYVSMATSKGMQIGFPDDFGIKDSRSETIRQAFFHASQNNCEFIFVVHSDSGAEPHADVKYAERQCSVISQAIRLCTLRNILNKNQPLTITNIVNKTNIKFGGINYYISSKSPNSKYVLDTETLYIGFGINHPGGGMGMQAGVNSGTESTGLKSKEHSNSIVDSPPTVVAFSANVGPNGPFDFEAMRDEKIDTVQMVVERCYTQFLYIRDGGKPKRVIIFRNGCGEGQFRQIIMYEVPLIKAALSKMGCENVLLTIIVANKLQNIRFFNQQINQQDKAPEQNVKVGTVVDHTVVHPLSAEFFLNSHRAIQGTSRTPKYTILYDDSKMKISQVEAITFQLCFGHQIIYSPVSVPSPVYIANRYAERGRMLYQRFMAHEGSKELTYADLTKRLCYYDSKNLFGRRVNA